MNLTTLRSWWWARAGLDGSLHGRSAAEVLDRAGWARSVGGTSPYLALFARAALSRAEVDAAVARLDVHELPSARGCTYVLPARDFALGLAVGQGFGGGEAKVAAKLGVTDREIDALCDAVLGALGDRPLAPEAIRAATGDASRGLGEEGKRKGLATTLPLALGRLQSAGRIRRVPVNGRLDQQRYGYVRWSGGPTETERVADAFGELARRFFRWHGPATAAEFQWFAGLGARAARDAMGPLSLVPAEPGSDRLLLPDDVDAWSRGPAAGSAQYALVGSLDPIVANRRELATLIDAADADRLVDVAGGRRPLGGLADLPSHAILDRGRLVGLWEYDPERGEIVAGTFDGRRDPALDAEVRRMETFVRDDLGDVRSFSLDSPARRRPRVEAIRRM